MAGCAGPSAVPYRAQWKPSPLSSDDRVRSLAAPPLHGDWLGESGPSPAPLPEEPRLPPPPVVLRHVPLADTVRPGDRGEADDSPVGFLQPPPRLFLPTSLLPFAPLASMLCVRLFFPSRGPL